MSGPLLPRASIRIGLACVALATAGRISAVEDGSGNDRHMVVLRAGLSLEEAESLRAELERSYDFQTIATFSEGAHVGLLASLDPISVKPLSAQSAVDHVQSVGAHTPPVWERGGRFVRVAPGWAVPGSYLVTLDTAGWNLDFGSMARQGRTIEPDERVKDDAKVRAVRSAAEALIATHGGRIISVFAPSSPEFNSAMTEAQALEMAADPRVRQVSETTYTLLK